MVSSQEPPLDEIQWRSPPIAQSMGGIHTNTGKLNTNLLNSFVSRYIYSCTIVLPYFSHSPFYDVTSNNAALTTQATYNPSMFHLIQTREAFEGRLRTMQGLEFMVAYEPTQNSQQPNGASGVEDTGAWVIRKQNRRKRQGAEDEITVLSTYFVIGENVYMAPSVGNVLGSRMVCLHTVSYLAVDAESTAIYCFVSHQAPLNGFVTTNIQTLSWLHIYATDTKVSNVGFKYPAHSTEQRRHPPAGHAEPTKKY